MDSYLEIATLQLLEAEGIIEIFCISGIDGEAEMVPKILAALQIVRGDSFGDGIGRIFHIVGKFIGKIEFRQNCVHLGFMLPGHTQYIGQMPVRIQFSSLPRIHHNSHLHPSFRTHLFRLLNIHLNIIRHILTLHKHPGLSADGVEDTHKLLSAALYYLHNLALTPAGRAFLTGIISCTAEFLPGDSHPYDIPI